MTDLVTFGESMLRLSPPGEKRLETAGQFDVHVGGAESNVAVAAARLGLDAVWLSKVPATPLGRHVTGELQRHGVTPAVVRSETGRQGTYYLESGDAPRGTDVVYDRTDAAVTTATAAELPTAHLDDATAFHTSGITPALSSTLADTTETLLARAQANDVTTTFDLNYRSKLATPEAAGDLVRPLLEHVDVLFVPERDAGPVLGVEGDAESIARTLGASHDIGTVVVTRGSDGALARAGETTTTQSVFPAGDAHPVGTGDAFVGGFLSQYVPTGNLDRALEWGAATAALKRSIPGDMALVSPPEVEAVLDGDTPALSR